MPFLPHDGLQFHYRETGSGLPFCFQHGLGADLEQPLALFRPPPGVRLICLDARAHGRTHPVGEADHINLRTFADDLLALLDHLGISRAVVGGISMGAASSLNFALRYPGRLLGLVLSRPAWLDGPNPWNVRMFTLISRLLQDHGAARGKELFLASAEGQETQAHWPDVAASLAAQFDHPQATETAFKFEQIIRDAPSLDRREFTTIAVPTLVLASRRDPIHPFAYGETLAALIPRARFRELTPKSVSLEQHTAEVQRYLDEFLRSLLAGH